MNVLSLFDGMSCGMIALERAGIKVDNYFSSEIDRYAIKVSQANYPEIKQLGDVTKWREWADTLPQIDLMFAGFPCQAWSFAGKQKGLDDPRGALALVLLDIFQHLKEKNGYLKFVFENVVMQKGNIAYLSGLFKTKEVMINSCKVSGQNRKRLYWSNIRTKQPRDKHILLKDALLTGEYIEPLLHSITALEYMNRKVKGGRTHWDFKHHSGTNNDKSTAVVANFFKGVPYNVLIDRRLDITDSVLAKRPGTAAHINCWKNMVNIGQKSKCLTASGQNISNASCTNINLENGIFRKLHTIECERLQTVPDNYTNHVSNTQRYKMLGNGWTVDVIAHILKGML